MRFCTKKLQFEVLLLFCSLEFSSYTSSLFWKEKEQHEKSLGFKSNKVVHLAKLNIIILSSTRTNALYGQGNGITTTTTSLCSLSRGTFEVEKGRIILLSSVFEVFSKYYIHSTLFSSIFRQNYHYFLWIVLLFLPQITYNAHKFKKLKNKHDEVNMCTYF